MDERLGGASRAFADIGVHWCDLAEFVSGQRIARLSARLLTAVPERRGHPVTTEDAAVIQFETDQGAIGSVVLSQITPGRKNRLWIELDGAEETLAFDQEHPEELWCGTREAVTILGRDPATLSPPAARFAFLPGGHPQGYADCFDAFVADCVREHPERLCGGRHADVRRRPARRAAHRRGAGLVPRRALGGRQRIVSTRLAALLAGE